MADLEWYTSASGWMTQSAPGAVALDSLRPCDAHPDDPQRSCPQCDDGPLLEPGYHADGNLIHLQGHEGPDGTYHDERTVAEWDHDTGTVEILEGHELVGGVRCPDCLAVHPEA